MNRILKN